MLKKNTLMLSALMLGLSAVGSGVDAADLDVPAALNGKATVLAPSDPAYARANVGNAVKAEGLGGVSQALVIQLSADLPVYRMWSGPVTTGNSNRMGSWWAFDRPQGSREGYRRAYEICGTWNELNWVAACTLKAGSVVAIGPGQSVSAQTCADSSGYETYGTNARDWQVYVDKAWSRGAELVCPPETSDYRANPADVTQPVTQ